LVPKMTNDN